MTIVDSYISYNDITAQEHAEGNGAAAAAKMTVTASPALEMSLAQLMKETNKAWADFEASVGRRDSDSVGATYLVLNDLALTIAARPARHWREAKKKIVLLAEHRHAVRLRGPTFVAILDAVIERECKQWDIFVVETIEHDRRATKH
jgi:hypothetical protein